MNLNFLSSDDIFVSYSRWDASTYAPGLADKLIEKGFSCFIDRYGTDPNRDLPDTLRRKIRSCRMFVLIATQRAAGSEAIEKEIREFQKTGRSARIVPIDIDGSLKSARWYELVAGIAPEPEKNVSALDDGNPSEAVVNRIEKSFKYVRGKDTLRRATVGASLLLALLLLLSAAASVYAFDQVEKAAQATLDAAVAQIEADEQRRLAAEAERKTAQAAKLQRDAETSRLLAFTEKTYADQQRTQAETAKAKATRQQQAAERQQAAAESLRDQAQAEAQRQGDIAESRQLANRSQSVLRQQPLRLAFGLSLAVDSMKKALGAHVDSPESDAALRDSLALFPDYERSADYKFDKELAILSLSPDALYYATLIDKSLRVFKAGETAPSKEIPCESCGGLALSNNAEFAAVGVATDTSDNTVRIFDLKNNHSRDVNLEKNHSISELALSPHGRYVAVIFSMESEESEGQTTSAEILDTETGKVVWKLDKEKERFGGVILQSVAFSPNGNLALGGSPPGEANGRALIWQLAEETKNEAQEKELVPFDFDNPTNVTLSEGIYAIVPGLDATSFATGIQQHATIWSLDGGKNPEPLIYLPLREFFKEKEFYVRHLNYNSSGTQLTITRDVTFPDPQPDYESADVWDVRGHREAAQVFHPGEIKNLAFLSDSNLITTVTGGSDEGGVARVFQSANGQETEQPQSISENMPVGKRMLYKSSDSAFIILKQDRIEKVRDVMRATEIQLTPEIALQSIEKAAFNSDGKFIALAGSGLNDGLPTILIYALRDGLYKQTQRLTSKDGTEDCSLSSDGTKLALLSQEHAVQIRNVSDGQDITPDAIRSLTGVEMIKLGPGGKNLVTRQENTGESKTETLQLWNLSGGSDPVNITHAEHINVVTFSPNERFLLTSGDDDETQLLALGTLQVKRIRSDSSIQTAAFSADERYFSIGSLDGLVSVFKTAAPEIEITRLQHKGIITGIAFSPDDNYLATASKFHHPYNTDSERDYPLRIFLLQPQGLIESAAKLLGNMSATTH